MKIQITDLNLGLHSKVKENYIMFQAQMVDFFR